MSAMTVPSVSSHISPLSLRPKRHPACRRREAQSSSCTERENLAGDARGKGTSGSIPEVESTEPARLWRHGGASADNLGETGAGSLVAKPAPDRSIRFVAVIEPPVASMRPRVISRGSIYCLARPAGAANSCRQRSGSRRHARLVEAGAAALSLHRAHFCRRRIPAPKMAKASAATSCARATSQGGATRPARAIAASVALRMPSKGSRLK
jgi:hypothetical protein